MWRVTSLSACVALLSIGATRSSAQQLTPTWVQLGDGGAGVARVVVASAGNCPSINFDGANHPMVERRPIPNGFRPLCEAAIPNDTQSANVGGQALALPKPNPSRVIALGDTGCRVKGKRVQACNDPAEWPFGQVALRAAIERPDLVIHVGDYLYRESPCPEGSEAMCGGAPAGDNWEAWNADFFIPAAKLLAASPWVFSRGNHEDCERSWRGWFYYLDPRPWTGRCEEYSRPYVVKLGAFELVMLDSSAVREDDADEKQIATYSAQLASIQAENAWLVDHHPFWGFKTDSAGGRPGLLSAPLQEAWNKAEPSGYSLIVSGHVHLFEFVSLDHGRPTQLVAGDGGTDLAVPIQMDVKGTRIRGATVVASKSQRQFGYTVLTKTGSAWELALKNRLGQVLVLCPVQVGSSGCQGLGTD
jgi:hypothetical protein